MTVILGCRQFDSLWPFQSITEMDFAHCALDRFSIQPLTILGVTGPFSVLAENIYSLCTSSFDVCWANLLSGL